MSNKIVLQQSIGLIILRQHGEFGQNNEILRVFNPINIHFCPKTPSLPQ